LVHDYAAIRSLCNSLIVQNNGRITIKTKLIGSILSFLLCAGRISDCFAVPVEFDYSGTDSGGYTVTGSFTINNTLLFNGDSFQGLPNTDLLSLSFTAAFSGGSASFSTPDIATYYTTFFDSSGLTPTVANAAGFLANNGLYSLTIFSGGRMMLYDDATSSYIADYSDPGSWTYGGPVSVPGPIGGGGVSIGFQF
jgi:hypothetical protein